MTFKSTVLLSQRSRKIFLGKIQAAGISKMARFAGKAEATFREYFTRDDRPISRTMLVKLARRLKIADSDIELADSNPFAPRSPSTFKQHQQTMSLSSSQEKVDIVAQEANYQELLKKAEHLPLFETAKDLSDKHRITGDYIKSLHWLAIAEFHLSTSNDIKETLKEAHLSKIEFKRILTRDFIVRGNLTRASKNYFALCSNIKSTHENSEDRRLWQECALSCHRQIAEIQRLQGRYSQSYKSFEALGKEYLLLPDLAAYRYCQLGSLECRRLQGDLSAIEVIQSEIDSNSRFEMERWRLRLQRMKFQLQRWHRSHHRDYSGLRELHNGDDAKLLERLYQESGPSIGHFYFSMERASMILEIVGSDTSAFSKHLPSTISNIKILSNYAKRQRLPMEAAHCNLLLCEANLLINNTSEASKHLLAAEEYYIFSGLASGIARTTCARKFLGVEGAISGLSFEGIDLILTHKIMTSREFGWSFSITCNLP